MSDRRFPMEQIAVFAELVDTIDEVLWVRDLVEERLLYVSPAFERIWGRPVADLLRSPSLWMETIHPDDREKVVSAVVSNARAGVDRVEYRIVRPDGAVRTIQDRAYPIRNAKGAVYRMAGVAEDITDRRKPE